jgi:initiation factor 1A
MVKNNGGNKAKKFARKSFNVVEIGTRYAKVDGEMYGIVNRMLGGSICEVLCIDGETRLCVIRKKFSGKRKRDNLLNRGKWVLVGLRDWEISKKSIDKCDLLEVYNDGNVSNIVKNTDHDFSQFFLISEEKFDKDSIEFSNESNFNFDEGDDEDSVGELDDKKYSLPSSNDDESDSEESDCEENEFEKDSIVPQNDEFKDMDDLMKNMIDGMGLIDEDDI